MSVEVDKWEFRHERIITYNYFMNQNKKTEWVVGIDEVGRGPIAGPVTVCALIMPAFAFKGSTLKGSQGRTLGQGSFDSKQLSAKKRLDIFTRIRELKKADQLDYRIASVNHKMIDQKGIVQAVHLAIKRSLELLRCPTPKLVEIMLDGGLRAPNKFKNQQTIIRGDAKVPIIGLASVIAKVHRDRFMVNSGTRHPNWGFEKNKGYGTREHYRALQKHGLSPIHRLSFLHKMI